METEPQDARTPGQLIRVLLEERGWTQTFLAEVLQVGQSVVNRLASDTNPVHAEMALQLSEVFGVPAERFLELQKAYDLAKARLKAHPDPHRATRARLFASLPVNEMIQRGWLHTENTRDVRHVEAALVAFFGVDSVDDIEVLPHAAKRTDVGDDVTPAQVAWLHRVRQIAGEMLAPPYSRTKAREAISQLQALLLSPEEARKVPRILTECGIRYVVVESLTSAKIDGVCFWLNSSAPVIGMSLRYDRMDNFWFVLRHELEHVLRGHGRAAVALDAELERERAGTGPEITEEERVANQAAADFCVPAKPLQQFIARKSPLFFKRDILGFARTLNIHPALVAGQLQHHLGQYQRFQALLVKIRYAVAPSAMVDGWGDVAPVGF
jgi:HTH-type transcriptional regulator/antitoxin HigA